MGRNLYRSMIRHRFQKINVLTAVLAERFGPEDIHAFRVEVKKLRALLRLMEPREEGSSHLLPEKLHLFYSVTGMIRNLQLQRSSLLSLSAETDHPLPPSCLAVLDGRLEIATRLAGLFLKEKHLFEKEQEAWLTGRSGKAGHEDERSFVNREMKAFPDPTGSAFPDEDHLHMMRKSMKDLLYVWPLLNKKARAAIRYPKQADKEAVRSLALLLGDFRDACLRLSLLRDKHFLLSAGPDAEPLLREADVTWLRDKQDRLRKIKRVLLSETGPGVHDDRDQYETGNPNAPFNLSALSYEMHVI